MSSAPAAPAPQSAQAGFQEAMLILNMALAGIAKLPVIGPAVQGTISADVTMALAFVSIIQTAQAAVKATSGQAIDLTRIPFENPVS